MKHILALIDNPWGMISLDNIKILAVEAYKYLRSINKTTSYVHDLTKDTPLVIKDASLYTNIDLDDGDTDVNNYNAFTKILNTIKRDRGALIKLISLSLKEWVVLQFDDIFVPEYLQYPDYTKMLFKNLAYMKISLKYNFVHAKINKIMDVYFEAINKHKYVMNVEGCIYYAWVYGYDVEHEKLIVGLKDKMEYYSSVNSHDSGSLISVAYHFDVDFEDELHEDEFYNYTSVYKIIGVSK